MSADVVWHGDAADKAAGEAMLTAGRMFMEGVLTAAVDAAPVESGTLRRSGTVTVGGLPEAPGEGSALLGGAMSGRSLGSEQAIYASFSTPYCIVMHEHTYHAKLAGGPKYLQRPFDAMKSQAESYIAAKVRQMLGAV